MSDTVSGKLIYKWLSNQDLDLMTARGCTKHFLNGVWLFGEVFSSSQMTSCLYYTGQMTDSICGITWASGLLISVLCGICYGRHNLLTTRVHFIDGNVNVQILWQVSPLSTAMPFIHQPVMLQRDNTQQPLVARTCPQFLACIVTRQWAYLWSMCFTMCSSQYPV